MTSFALAAGLMLLVALAFVLVPLWRAARPIAAPSGEASNLAVFRSQKREIEDDFARGALNAAERDQALAELSQRLLQEVPGAGATAAQAGGRPWPALIVLAALLPVAAFSLYAVLGTPRALDGVPVAQGQGPGQAPGQSAGDAPQISDKQILGMVDQLAKKMEENPGDPKGWILLARSQAALGRFAEATQAFERAVKLQPGDAQLLADYADAVAVVQQGRFDGKPLQLIRDALKADPNNLKALALAGTAELRLGNREKSLAHWEKLKGLVRPGSDDFQQVSAIIAEIRTGKAQPLPLPDAQAAAAAPSAPAAPMAPPAVQANPATTVTGQVFLAPEVAGKLAAGDTLFIFARAKDGPRMPLAVVRNPAPAATGFPRAFELTEAMAMAPGMTLASFPEVVIEARISKSGNAQLQPGDLSGTSDPVKPGTRGVRVTVSKVAP